MNKFAVVLTVAAVATLSGCKDPNFKRGGASNTADVRLADTQPATPTTDTGTQAPEVNDAPAGEWSAVSDPYQHFLAVSQIGHFQDGAERICAVSTNKGVVMQACAAACPCACRPF